MTGHAHGKHCKNNPVLTKTIWHVSDMKNKWKQQKNASPYMSWKHSMWYLQPKKTHRSNYENLSGDTWQLSNTAPIATAMCTTKHCFLEICNFLFVAAQQTRGYHAEMPISARKPFISAIIMKTRRNGPLGKSSPIIICSFDTSDMLTIVSYSVTSASLHLHHTKSSWTKASTENPSFSRRNLTKNSLVSCSKRNLWSWFTRDRPMSLKSFHPFQLPLQKSSSVVSAHAATSSSRVPSLLFVFNKVWPN